MSTTTEELKTSRVGSPEQIVWITPTIDSAPPQVQEVLPRFMPTASRVDEVRQQLENYEQTRKEAQLKEETIKQEKAEQHEAFKKINWVTKIQMVGQALAQKAQETVQNIEKRKAFASKALDETYAFAIGLGTKTIVLGLGTIAVVSATGATAAAAPLAALGVMSAAAAREIYKNWDTLKGKKSGREFFKQELGQQSYNYKFDTTNPTNTLSKIARASSRGLKDRAITREFNVKKHEEALKQNQERFGSTAVETFQRLSQQALQELGAEATQKDQAKKVASYAVEGMKTAKLALDTATTKETRVQARQQIKDLYQILKAITYEQSINGSNRPNKETRDELKQMMQSINAELNANAKSAAIKSVGAAAQQQVLRWLTFSKVIEAFHYVTSDPTKVVYAADTHTQRTVQKMYMPLIKQSGPTPDKTIVTPTHNPIKEIKQSVRDEFQSMKKEAFVKDRQLPTFTINRGEWLFLGLKHNGFDIEAKGSAQKFIDQVVPNFKLNGQVTDQDMANMNELIKGDNGNHSVEWLRWQYNNKYGANTFDKLFTVQPNQKITLFDTNSVTQVPAEAPKIVPPVAEAPRITAPKPALEQPTTPTVKPEPKSYRVILPLVVNEQTQQAVTPTIQEPIKEVIKQRPTTINNLRIDLSKDHPITVSSDREDIFNFTNTAPIKEWFYGDPSQDPPVDQAMIYHNTALEITTVYGHSARTGQGINKGIQWLENARYWVSRGYKDSTKLSEIQINNNLNMLKSAQPTLNFDQNDLDIHAHYKLIDVHNLNHYQTQTMGQLVDTTYGAGKDSLLVVYCDRAHSDAFKMLNLTNLKIPRDIQDQLDIAQGLKPGNIKEAVKAVSEWYASRFSPKDTAQVLADFKNMAPDYLKPSINILMDGKATDDQVQSATNEIEKWLLKEHKDDWYPMFRMMLDAFGNTQKDPLWVKENFPEYYSWNRQILVYVPTE